MKITEIINEDWDSNPYRDTTLPLSNYRGLNNPFDRDYSQNDDATTLWDMVDDMIDQGIEPHVMNVNIISLRATQDWLSSEPSDEVLFDEYSEHPVVLKYRGVNHILDGHNRVARAVKQGKTQITVYLFGLQ